MSHKAPSILCADPKAQYLAHADEIQAAISRVLESGWYILGKEVSAFEAEFASYIGVAHGIGVANGTDAIAVALKACGVTAGDEVITVSHSAVATVAAVEQIGATPVFCDISPVTRGLDPKHLPSLVTKKTRAIVPVHIYGHPVDIESICAFARERGIKVVEDCAQAHGAKINGKNVGSFGDIAAFSFYPTKNLGAIGDGGGIVTNSAELAQSAGILRQYGWKERYISSVAGVNTRLDELQAAILRVKLKYLESDNLKRNQIADRYDQALAGSSIKAPLRPAGITHAMHLYVAEHPKRDELKTFLGERGIQAALHYPAAIHQQPAYQGGRIRGADSLKETERLYRNIISLPMYPELEIGQQEQVIDGLKEWLTSND